MSIYCGEVKVGELSINIVDCKSWSLYQMQPRCSQEHDVSQCESCSHRQTREGNLQDPPIFIDINASQVEKPLPKQIKGLGDAIEAVTKAVGIKTCGGCAQRRDKLNALVPFKRSPVPPHLQHYLKGAQK